MARYPKYHFWAWTQRNGKPKFRQPSAHQSYSIIMHNNEKVYITQISRIPLIVEQMNTPACAWERERERTIEFYVLQPQRIFQTLWKSCRQTQNYSTHIWYPEHDKCTEMMMVVSRPWGREAQGKGASFTLRWWDNCGVRWWGLHKCECA